MMKGRGGYCQCGGMAGLLALDPHNDDDDNGARVL
jgi:hypothetical protein